MPDPTRKDDEAVLSWLRKRSEGMPTRRIAMGAKRPAMTIIEATRAVRNADLHESGEPQGAVGRHYHWKMP